MGDCDMYLLESAVGGVFAGRGLGGRVPVRRVARGTVFGLYASVGRRCILSE